MPISNSIKVKAEMNISPASIRGDVGGAEAGIGAEFGS
jgi:hypothetical protein